MQLSSVMFESEFLFVAAAQQQSANWAGPSLQTIWLTLGTLTVREPIMDIWTGRCESVYVSVKGF